MGPISSTPKSCLFPSLRLSLSRYPPGGLNWASPLRPPVWLDHIVEDAHRTSPTSIGRVGGSGCGGGGSSSPRPPPQVCTRPGGPALRGPPSMRPPRLGTLPGAPRVYRCRPADQTAGHVVTRGVEDCSSGSGDSSGDHRREALHNGQDRPAQRLPQSLASMGPRPVPV